MPRGAHNHHPQEGSMNLYNTNPLDPFGRGLPGDPMEQVLSLQSYSVAGEAFDCVSKVSCNSSASCNSEFSESGGGPTPTTPATPVDTIA
jgi:hypothetical protein